MEEERRSREQNERERGKQELGGGKRTGSGTKMRWKENGDSGGTQEDENDEKEGADFRGFFGG